MELRKLSQAPISMKLVATVLFCIIGLIYVTLLINIFIDSEMKPSVIAEAYGGMEYMELSYHAHNYLPYYALFLFAVPVVIFMFTSYRENIKCFFAVFPFIVIVVDIASMFLIPYVWTGFAWILWLAGTCLGLMFFTLFVLTMYDLWLRRA